MSDWTAGIPQSRRCRTGGADRRRAERDRPSRRRLYLCLSPAPSVLRGFDSRCAAYFGRCRLRGAAGLRRRSALHAFCRIQSGPGDRLGNFALSFARHDRLNDGHSCRDQYFPRGWRAQAPLCDRGGRSALQRCRGHRAVRPVPGDGDARHAAEHSGSRTGVCSCPRRRSALRLCDGPGVWMAYLAATGLRDDGSDADRCTDLFHLRRQQRGSRHLRRSRDRYACGVRRFGQPNARVPRLLGNSAQRVATARFLGDVVHLHHKRDVHPPSARRVFVARPPERGRGVPRGPGVARGRNRRNDANIQRNRRFEAASESLQARFVVGRDARRGDRRTRAGDNSNRRCAATGQAPYRIRCHRLCDRVIDLEWVDVAAADENLAAGQVQRSRSGVENTHGLRSRGGA